jgi:hypothetical protein
MTLESTVRQKLSEWRPADGRHELTIPGPGASLSLAVDQHEELGCLVWELTAQRAQGGETLRAWAERIARCITVLMGPLKVVEIDEQRGEAMLRSDKPQPRADKVIYFELMLHGTQRAVLRRYEGAHANGSRAQISFAITHEAIAKLAADLTAQP